MRADLNAESLRRMALQVDSQSLMVELDRRGVFAGEIGFEPDGESGDRRR